MTFFGKLRKQFISFSFIFLALPASGSYEMHDFGFGAGGVGVSDSTSYSVTGIAGEVSGEKGVGTTYNAGNGLIFTQQANVPGAPTFSNTANYYNKLKFVLDTGSNPTDTLFAIAISTDDFATTNYIQADGTIDTTAVYQTYADWGGASGEFVVGLSPSTTYKVKVKAVHTKYTETEFSIASSATTDAPSLTYDIDVSSSDSETGPPYTVNFGTLSPGSVTTATEKIWIDITTNGEGGGFVYLYNSTGGLTSTNAGYTIPSATANLSSVSEGYGLQVATDTETSGGPLTAVTPYNGVSENVGVIDTTARTIFTTNSAPISGGRGSIFVKAKSSTVTPAAADYSDTITMIASSTF